LITFDGDSIENTLFTVCYSDFSEESIL